MAVAQNVIFTSLAILAVSSFSGGAVQTGEPQPVDRYARSHLMGLFRHGSLADIILRLLAERKGALQEVQAALAAHASGRPSDLLAAPLAGDGQGVVQAALDKCSPSCRSGYCCLQINPNSQATCQKTQLSGDACAWNHYTNPSDLQATYTNRSMCPCAPGMACVSATATKLGICTFFK